MTFSHKDAVPIYICARTVPKQPLCLSAAALPASMGPVCCEYVCTIVFLRPAAVSCGAPSAPVNGGVLATDYSVGTRVTYFCNSGYRLSSKELTTTVCQPDSTWSNHNKIPRCIGKKRIRCGEAAG